MPVIHTCKNCGKEAVVERVFSGSPLRCTHCSYKEGGDMNGNTIWIGASAKDTPGESG
jgi:ribosomal protein L37AE/L43A